MRRAFAPAVGPAALALLGFWALVAGCSTRLDVLNYEELDDLDASLPLDAAGMDCAACAEGYVCVLDRCMELATKNRLAAGVEHTCMIGNGVLSCWGSNGAAQLGSGNTVSSPVPAAVGRDADWLEIAAGGRHSCGLRAPGMLFCWGDNSQGQLGLGTMAGARSRSFPERVRNNIQDFTKVSCAGDSCCALRAGGGLYCWGSNTDGNAGINRANGLVAVPTQVMSEARFGSVSVGATHSCAIRDDGLLFCWGRNVDGELGLGANRTARRSPTQVGMADDWLSVSCGLEHTCGILRGGMLLCWGGSDFSQAGVGREAPDGVPLIIDVPTEVDMFGGWELVAAGGYHNCARKARAADVYCWGRASQGQLGLGGSTGDVVELPRKVSSPSALRQLALGTMHSCALDTHAQLFCWGDNAQGQLGFGDALRRDQPELVR